MNIWISIVVAVWMSGGIFITLVCIGGTAQGRNAYGDEE